MNWSSAQLFMLNCYLLFFYYVSIFFLFYLLMTWRQIFILTFVSSKHKMLHFSWQFSFSFSCFWLFSKWFKKKKKKTESEWAVRAIVILFKKSWFFFRFRQDDLMTHVSEIEIFQMVWPLTLTGFELQFVWTET